MSTLEQDSDATELDAPAAQRYTLPARAYTDPAILERERREVFARAWTIACHVSHVAEPGQFATTSIAGEPVAVLRDNDGELQALSNVCRHRAMKILDGKGSCPRVLRCPYHGWTYRQDGQLAAVPEARGFPALDREAVRLPRFRVEVRAGLVWVSLSDETEPIDEFLGELGPRLESLGLAQLVPLEKEYVNEYPHNWKVVADNYLEGYHIPVGHPGLLRLLDYKRYVATLARRGAWIDGPFRDKASNDRRERLYQRLMRPMPGFPEELKGAWTYVHVWPAQMIDIYPDMMDTWRIEPAGAHVRRTRTHAMVFRHPDEGLRDRLVRKLNWRINGLVMDEDVELCDGVQEGLEALTYERGVLNATENAVANFHDLLREAVPGIDDA